MLPISSFVFIKMYIETSFWVKIWLFELQHFCILAKKIDYKLYYYSIILKMIISAKKIYFKLLFVNCTFISINIHILKLFEKNIFFAPDISRASFILKNICQSLIAFEQLREIFCVFFFKRRLRKLIWCFRTDNLTNYIRICFFYLVLLVFF